jgi:hypothetical protein
LSGRRTRERIPQLLVRDLLAVGLLTADRLPAWRRLEQAVGVETASVLREIATPPA